MDSAIENCNKSGDFHYIKGEIYKRMKSFDKAKEEFTKAIKFSSKLSYPKEVIEKELNAL